LRELLDSGAIVNLFDLAAGEVEWLAAAGATGSGVGPESRSPSSSWATMEALSAGENAGDRRRRAARRVPKLSAPGSGVHMYMVVPMIAGGEAHRRCSALAASPVRSRPIRSG